MKIRITADSGSSAEVDTRSNVTVLRDRDDGVIAAPHPDPREAVAVLELRVSRPHEGEAFSDEDLDSERWPDFG